MTVLFGREKLVVLMFRKSRSGNAMALSKAVTRQEHSYSATLTRTHLTDSTYAVLSVIALATAKARSTEWVSLFGTQGDAVPVYKRPPAQRYPEAVY